MMLETPHQTEQVGHANVLAMQRRCHFRCTHAQYEIIFLFEKVWNFGLVGPMKQLIKLKWPDHLIAGKMERLVNNSQGVIGSIAMTEAV